MSQIQTFGSQTGQGNNSSSPPTGDPNVSENYSTQIGGGPESMGGPSGNQLSIPPITHNNIEDMSKYKSISNFDDFTSIDPSRFPFELEGYLQGLKSTQQLNVDFAKFENHTFFDSAVSKVNIAFDRIVNDFPFDSKRFEIDEWRRSLTGFEKYVLDRFANSKGYLMLSGSGESRTNGNLATNHGPGNFVTVFNQRGKLYPDFSKVSDAKPALTPLNSPFTVECWLKLPNQTNQNETIVQLGIPGSDGRGGMNYGFGLFLSGTSKSVGSQTPGTPGSEAVVEVTL